MPAFSFTYSKLKNYETCGLQHQMIDIRKTPGWGPQGDAIDYGNRVHGAISAALKGEAQLPPQMKYLQYWVNHVNRVAAELPESEKFIETGWGLSRDYDPIDFFSKQAWMRLKVDAAIVCRKFKYGQLIDWKTGRRLEEPLQLWLGAAMMFQWFPELETIDSMFVWLKEDDGTNSKECISSETIMKKDIGDVWDQILPRVQIYEEAVATDTFMAKPGDHCRWCRVQSCDFYGKPQA